MRKASNQHACTSDGTRIAHHHDSHGSPDDCIKYQANLKMTNKCAERFNQQSV